MGSKLTAEQISDRRRILEISHAHRLSHLGSCLSSVDIIHAIYRLKKCDERFILSNGHAGIALYVVLEKYCSLDLSNMEKFHIHPDRDPKAKIDLSTGSLGHGLPIAAGMALANRRKNVYCLISDGECAEGSVWEALRVAGEQRLSNLKIVVNANGWGAYGPISASLLYKRIKGFGYNAVRAPGHDVRALIRALKTVTTGRPLIVFARTKVEHFPFLRGQGAHYHVMSDNDYAFARERLS